MIDISRPQFKMLLKIKRARGLYADSLSLEELSICEYLLSNGCISDHTVPGSASPLLKITQFGDAQIYIFASTFYKWWIPVIISIIALIISIAVPLFQALL